MTSTQIEQSESASAGRQGQPEERLWPLVREALGGSRRDLTAMPLSRAKIIRQILYAPPSMPVLDLLAKMQTTRIHLALVVDEYGGADGVVSLAALRWLADQNASFVMLNRDGSVLLTTGPARS